MKEKHPLTVKNNKKVVLLYLGLLFGFFGILSKVLYRPLILNAPINDFGIQGFAPNFFAALSLSLVASFWVKKGHIKTMIAVSCGILVYELEQYWTDRTFDYFDIIATILGLGMSVLIFISLDKRDGLKE